MKRIFLALFVSISMLPVAKAAEKETVCAKYQADYGWSKGYEVVATVIKGRELNQATRTFNYNGFSTYVVIFWDKDQASVIEMDSFYRSSFMGQEGKDQRGVKWEISKTAFCF